MALLPDAALDRKLNLAAVWRDPPNVMAANHLPQAAEKILAAAGDVVLLERTAAVAWPARG